MRLVWVIIFFFFSSRRRHTRFDCDWSSDVCSSDLVMPEGKFFPGRPGIGGGDRRRICLGANHPLLRLLTLAHSPSRSEERRVGKSVDLGGRRIIKKKKNKVVLRDSCKD